MDQTGTGTAFSVGEVARIAGVTVRTLHHYDEIGLLRPSARTGSGYRSYDAGDLDRLQHVLGYRELGFGLDQITALLDGHGEPVEHLRRQRELLLRRIERLRRMVETLDRTMEAHTMGIRLTPEEMLEVFGHDPTEHAQEAQQRWGETEAWRQSRQRTAEYTKQDWSEIKAEADAINQRLAAAMAAGIPAGDPEPMDAARAHRQHINRWFYDCGTDLHRGLAAMYVADERFALSYDSIAPGLARYVHDAVLAEADRADGLTAGG